MRRVLPIAGAVVAACGGDAAPVGSATADSAGVAIVTSTAPQWTAGSGWRVDTTPSLSIGEADADTPVLLINVAGVRELSDGRIAVAVGDDRAVRYFDAAGAPLASVGRDGAGPGEFRALALIGSRADSLYVWDAQLDRLTVLAPDATVARTAVPPAADSGAEAPRLGWAPIGILGGDGLLLSGRIGASSGDASGLRRDSIPLARATGDGRLAGMVARVPGNEVLVITTPQYVSLTMKPFGATTVVQPSGDDVLVSVGDRDEVRRYRGDGGLAAIWRLDRARRAVPATDVELLGRRHAEQLRQLPASMANAMRTVFLEAGVPRTLPTHDQMLVDPSGHVWLREDVGIVRRDTVDQRWTVLDREGRWLGTVVTPRRLVVHQVMKDAILGVWRDEDGVEYVRRHRLRR